MVSSRAVNVWPGRVLSQKAFTTTSATRKGPRAGWMARVAVVRTRTSRSEKRFVSWLSWESSSKLPQEMVSKASNLDDEVCRAHDNAVFAR